MKEDSDNKNTQKVWFYPHPKIILSKDEARYYIKEFFLRKYFVFSNDINEESIKELANSFLEFYNLKDRRKNRIIKPNKKIVILRRARGVCEKAGCNNQFQNNPEIHHIIQFCLGGSNDLNNLVCICKTCHDEISKFQQLAKERVAKILFIEYPKINSHEESLKYISEIEEIQEDFYKRYKFNNVL